MFTGKSIDSLRFGAWNIDSLSDKVSDPSFINEISNFDFITLVETWLPPETTIDIDGFTCVSKSRNTHPKARRYSSGIALLVKDELKKGLSILQCSADEFLWWKLDKSFFHLEDDVFICSVYIPPNSSSREKTRDFDAFTSLEEHIVKCCAYGQVILCGDFNARTGLESDFFETSNNNLPIDLNICFDNSITSDKYNHRNNRDSDATNTSGQKLLEVCKTFNLRFLNGRSRGDNFGQYTYFRPNGKSVIEYVITSIDLLNNVHLFKVRHLT